MQEPQGLNGGLLGAIAGIIFPDVLQADHVIESMLAALEHRGPHERDSFSYKNVKLGARGSHVAFNEKKSTVAVVDGSIYNITAIQLLLQKEGFKITDGSPGEIVVHAYDAWGEDFAKKIDGDYSIAIYDKLLEKLVITRDRIGTKPLYWCQLKDTIYFASELKALLATGEVPQNPALDSIAAYLRLGYIPQDMTPIENVNKLLPGYTLTYTIAKGLSIHQYWSYSSYVPQNVPSDLEETAVELDRRLKASILSRIPAEGNVGCYLSGGLGSATTAYYLKDSLANQNIESFSLSFGSLNQEDFNAASAFSNVLDIKQQTTALTPKLLMKDFINICWYLDEPIADPNSISSWNLAKLASSQVPVAFSGMGSDELLAGHSRYSSTERTSPYLNQITKSIISPFLHCCILPVIALFSEKYAYQFLRKIKTDPWQAEYMNHFSIFSEDDIDAASPTLKNLFDADIFIHKFPNLENISSHVTAFRYFDIKTRLPDCYLAQYERLNTAFGIDWKSPFFDLNIIELFASYLDPESIEESETAILLKRLFSDKFPSDILNRPKKTRRGFFVPWLQQTEIPTLFRLLINGSLVEAGIISSKWLHKKTATMEAIVENYDKLWTLLTLEVWFRLFINFPIHHYPPDISIMELLNEKNKGN